MAVIPLPQSAVPPFSVGPGMTTSNTVGSTYQTPSMETLAWQKYADEQKEKRKQEWANAAAKNNAAFAERQRADYERQHGTPEQNLRASFDAMYGPQIQRAYQEAAIGSAPINSVAGKARDYSIQHGGPTGGYIGQPGSDPVKYAVSMAPLQGGGQPQVSMRPDQIQNTLNNMWRQQTDPYQAAASKMGGFMAMFHPSNVWHVAKSRTKGGPPQEDTKKEEDYTQQMLG